MAIGIEIAPEGDAVYLKLKEGKFAKNEVIDDQLVVDRDAKGNILGIEIIGILKKIPVQELSKLNLSLPLLQKA